MARQGKLVLPAPENAVEFAAVIVDPPNRKNALFAGHDAGAENWATIASLIETCKLNTVDPLAYLTSTLTAIANGHKQRQIEGLLPRNYSLA
jgi:hypothetical protein